MLATPSHADYQQLGTACRQLDARSSNVGFEQTAGELTDLKTATSLALRHAKRILAGLKPGTTPANVNEPLVASVWLDGLFVGLIWQRAPASAEQGRVLSVDARALRRQADKLRTHLGRHAITNDDIDPLVDAHSVNHVAVQRCARPFGIQTVGQLREHEATLDLLVSAWQEGFVIGTRTAHPTQA